MTSSEYCGAADVAIEVEALTKRYDTVTAVDEVAFAVRQGEIFGFLGPNGAGKTTTINMLIGLARPSSGRITISGIDCSKNPKAAQHLMGVVPDESNLYPELTGFENLCFCGALYGMRRRQREQRARELLAMFGLDRAAGRSFGSYSKGMKRKCTIAAGIIHSPQILFLDEPTSGIDVASARQIRRLIRELNADGTTVFLTTHYIEEAERLCGRVAFIVEGRIVALDGLDALMRDTEGREIVQFEVVDRPRLSALQDEVRSAFGEFRCSFDKAGLRVESRDRSPLRIGPLVRYLEEQGLEVLEARRLRPSLEEVFVRIAGIEPERMADDAGAESPTGGSS